MNSEASLIWGLIFGSIGYWMVIIGAALLSLPYFFRY